MNIAILGAGFAGLSAAWHLLQYPGCAVTLFDPAGIGGGASGMAAGLMHPYVGEEGKRSLLAGEGIAETQQLIAVSEKMSGKNSILQRGILRHLQSSCQVELFEQHARRFADVERVAERLFLIHSGLTIDCPTYLEGLWQAVSSRGGKLILSAVSKLSALHNFDQVVIAAGAGIAQFPELSHMQYSVLKGQILKCRAPESLHLPDKSLVGKGYVACSSIERVCYLGSTYERGVSDPAPDLEKAKQLLIPKIAAFFPDVTRLEVLECKAGMRALAVGHYFPLVGHVGGNLWVFSALGSRGLLYHGLLGKLLVEAIMTENRSVISWQSIHKSPK